MLEVLDSLVRDQGAVINYKLVLVSISIQESSACYIIVLKQRFAYYMITTTLVSVIEIVSSSY